MTRDVYISGGSGYVGVSLIGQLLARGHRVRGLVRPGSERKLPQGCEVVTGDAFHSETFAGTIVPSSTFVHLLGTPHPAPWKGDQFRAIDLVSLRASVTAARTAGVDHFVYVSVAHPAPVMKDYIAVRSECEAHIADLRPWYVLGPGHRWPIVLQPAYNLMRAIPATRAGALRLGLVTLTQMTRAMLWAIENSPAATQILEVPEIRRW